MTNRTRVTKDGLEQVRPGREALTGAADKAPAYPGRRRRGEQPMVPEAEFRSYYGEPIINQPVWESPDIPGYFFLGGLAGASAILGAGAGLTGRKNLARTTKVGALAAAGLGGVALVHDLGMPGRFYNMLRVFKPTSPMSVGSWILAGFSGAAAVAAASEVTGVLPTLGTTASLASAALGAPLAAYTAVLIADTAVPSWHEARHELPLVFVASAATAAGGLGLLGAPLAESAPARRLGVVGGVAEVLLSKAMEKRLGMLGEPYREGRAQTFMRAAGLCTAAGVVGAVVGRRSRALSALAGAALLAGSAFSRFGIFEAGLQSAEDPRYTVVPQRGRLHQRPA